MVWINEQSSDHPEWPKVKIIRAEPIDNVGLPDDEPFTQKLYLSCGHWLLNRYGDRFRTWKVGEEMGCRTCFVASSK